MESLLECKLNEDKRLFGILSYPCCLEPGRHAINPCGSTYMQFFLFFFWGGGLALIFKIFNFLKHPYKSWEEKEGCQLTYIEIWTEEEKSSAKKIPGSRSKLQS